MRFLIRADASEETGTGHVMRVLGLAEGLRSLGHDVAFLHRCPQSLRKRLGDEGFLSMDLDRVPGSPEDAATTIELATQMDTTWVIADGYAFDVNYQKGLRDADLRLLLVDDNGDANGYSADLVLNQSLHARPSLYGNSYDDRRFLLGGEYALFRREFRSRIGFERRIVPTPLTLLISLGGLPDPSWLSKVVRGAADTGMEIRVAGGAASNWQYQFDPSESVAVLPHVDDMAELIASCDIGLTAGGGTTREFLFLGLPFAVVDVAENQVLQSKFLVDEGLALGLGSIETLRPTDIEESIRILCSNTAERVRMSKMGQARVDGFGVDRVIDRLLLAGDGRDSTS